MPLLILKFGGTSVGSCEKITKVAKLIKKYHDKKKQNYCCIFGHGWGYK